MKNTKIIIMEAALRLFAREGYTAASMNDIAAEVGVTKGALYRHYAGKRKIFDSILARMAERDAENANEYDVPAETAAQNPSAYRNTQLTDLCAYTLSMFRYWTQDPFAAAFHRMLALERYRDTEMEALYQNYLGTGPLSYVEDLFREMGLHGNPKDLALEFYAPMYSMIDLGIDGEAILIRHMNAFSKKYGGQNEIYKK